MSGKNQFPVTMNWQSTNPQTNFLPPVAQWGGGSQPSGVISGIMTGTTTIYSQIIDISRIDNIGAEVTWTDANPGPTGTLSVLVSNSGINWPALTFNPALAQPAGTDGGGYAINFTQIPFRYLMFQYTNISGVGALTIYLQLKDLN